MIRAVSWGAWWFVLFWAWLLYNGQWTHVELVAAASAGAVGATAAEVVRTQALHRLCFRRQHLVRFWRPLWEIFPQFLDVGARALALPFSDRRGAFVTQDVGGPTGSEDPVGHAERVFVTYAATLSPNDYVVDIERERKLALRHVLVRERLSTLP